MLNAAELDRGRRYRLESDRNSFLKTRAVLRHLLGEAVGLAPKTLQICQNTWGKPMLSGQARDLIDFSVSRTEGLSAIAVSEGCRLGIDIERIRPVVDRDRIVARIFDAPVAQSLSRLQEPEQDCAFFRLWTATEAFLKAIGTGFAGTRARVPICLSEDAKIILLDEMPWTLRSLSLSEEFLGHVVVESPMESTIPVAGARCH